MITDRVSTGITCPKCGEGLLLDPGTFNQDDGAPLVSPSCWTAWWPSQLTRNARLGDKPNLADLKGDSALWSELRRGRPEDHPTPEPGKPPQPGVPEAIMEYALSRLLMRIGGY